MGTLIDVRDQLLRSTTVPQVSRQKTKFVTVHYNGPSIHGASDLALLKADARFHVNTRGWDGLAYHYAAGQTGAQYQCRDHIARLNHSGVPQGNSESLSVLTITGEGDPLPDVQVAALENIIVQLKINPRWVLGHKEWPRLTACPGAKLTRWLATYRSRYSAAGETQTITSANVRDEPSTLSHLIRTEKVGTAHKGIWMLGFPFKGDSLWFNILGTTDYLHGSVVDTRGAPEWTR